MLAVEFGKVTLSKAAKYLMLVVANSQTKRTNVSQWTSNPVFESLQVDESVEKIELKLCEATSDRKLKIVGTAFFAVESYADKEVVAEVEARLEQQVEGEKICVGIAYVTVRRAVSFQEGHKLINPQGAASENGQAVDEGQQFQSEEQQEPNQQVRVEFHCGFGFYLGSAFRCQIQWGKQTYSTNAIKDKINPVWFESTCLSGLSRKKLEFRVCDQKNNILENIRVDIAELRVMFTYHLRIKFKDQIMGATPQVFVSIVRESFPLFSIAEIPVRFKVRSLGEITKPLTYLMVSLNKELRLPIFIEVDRAKMSSLQLVNKYINSKSVGEQDRIEMVGLPTPEQPQSFSILKSYMNRKLFMHIFSVAEIRSTFQDQNTAGLRIIETKSDFEAVLRKIYYNNETFTVKKYLEIYNSQMEMEKTDPNSTAQERWKVLSNNYLLRNNIVLATKKHIEQLRKTIEAKGQQLVELKKVVAAVRNISKSLGTKEKLMNSIKAKKIKYNSKEITNQELITALLSKQGELEQKKNINAELALRMDCLADVQENHQDLEAQLLQNAQALQEQQSKLQKMRLMQRELAKQRELIGELQKMFESREIDRRVNEALKEQSEKLREIKQKKQNDLMRVYETVKQQGREGGTLAARIKRAEETLINLNEQYARMVAL